jgi:predicted ester cyclase
MAREARRCAWIVPALCLLFSAGCSPEPTASNKHQVRNYLQSFLVAQEWPRWPEYFTPDAAVNGSTLALQIMRGTSEGLHFALSGIEIEVLAQVEEGNRVATYFTVRGRHDGPFEGLAPTHRDVAIDGYVFDRFSGERVVDSRMILDLVGLSRQIAGLAGSGR